MPQLETPHPLLTVAAFLVLIGTLVVVHELGHYLVGRWFGVKAEKFSIGFGPQLFGWTDRRGTLWRVGALPLGGYVQFAGDMNPASQADEAWKALPDAERNQTFQSKTLWQRALIVFAGPAVNFLLAVLIFMGFLLAFGKSVTPPVLDVVVPGSPAAIAGLQPGDRVLTLNGHTIETFDQMAGEVIMIPGEEIVLEIERGGERITKEVAIATAEEIDRFGNKYRIGRIGVGASEVETREVGLLEAPVAAIEQTYNVLRQQMIGLGQIISGRRPLSELGGPLKIAKVSGEAMSLGILTFISLAALISINLGFINLLPIPMLDGGHLMLYAIEAVRRRPATPQVQEWAFRAGFAMLLCFMIMVTFNDLASFGLFASG
ncbi:MAG: RIP metalloprotease RseP [Sphingomonadaceae bacterium]|nr:RIP metalloprotease RseP [Sphingomonadaceae bacterium]